MKRKEVGKDKINYELRIGELRIFQDVAYATL